MKCLIPSSILVMLFVVFAHAQEKPPDNPLPPAGSNTTSQTMADIARAADIAMQLKDYDRAIQLDEQGIALAPKEPSFWGNKGMALLRRALFNNVKSEHVDDQAQRKQLVESARSDIRAAFEASGKALDLFAKVPEPTDPARIASHGYSKVKLLKFQCENAYFMAKLVDESYYSIAITAMDEYVPVAAEPEKTGVQLELGEMLIGIRKFREAIDIYQKILINDSRNADANLGAAVAFISLGFETSDKVSQERGLEFLDAFIAEAPARHPIRGSAEQVLKYLRSPKPLINTPQRGIQPAESGVSGGVINGKALKLVQPPFPAIANFAHADGVVAVRVLIDEEGNVKEAAASSGHPLLHAVSVEAALNSKFAVTTVSGEPVKVFGEIVYKFVHQ